MSDTIYRVGFIGVGKPWKSDGATGFGMAHQHADGYVRTGRCTLAACADPSEGAGRFFAEKYGVPRFYSDPTAMLAEEKLDIVSVCTWPHLHAPMTIAAARSGVKAIHCEKPMATTWGEAKEMARVCEENGVKLTFNHQRRFLGPYQAARAQVQAGAIGELTQIEGNCGDLYDWGTHWLDMFFFYNGETPAKWVLAQIDSREERKIFGVPMENQGLCEFQFENGVRAFLATGRDSQEPAAHRLIGTEGMIEVRGDAPHVRLMNGKTNGWQTIEQPDDLHGPDSVERAIADVVDAVATGRESLLSARNALRSTEVIFAAYESSRRRGRVDLPLTQADHAFVSMLERGDIGPGVVPA